MAIIDSVNILLLEDVVQCTKKNTSVFLKMGVNSLCQSINEIK